MRDFIVIGENIHCSRSVRTAGPRVRDGAIPFDGGALPAPAAIRDGAEWAGGKVRPCAVAAWQALHGDDAGRAAAWAYIGWLARSQVAAGAQFLDLNVDAFSADASLNCAAMHAFVCMTQAAVNVPVSVDSANLRVLEAGLGPAQVARRFRGAPLLNSVSLGRQETVALAAAHGADVVASCAGENDVPATVEGRLANLARLLDLLAKAGITGARVHVDPLVLPVATDGTQPGVTLAAIREVRRVHGQALHVTGGYSNVSFGLPQRRLLNEVFAWLALEAGADGGIVDPLLSGPARLAVLDPASEPFRLARAVLCGEDEDGLAFLAAAREGKLG